MCLGMPERQERCAGYVAHEGIGRNAWPHKATRQHVSALAGSGDAVRHTERPSAESCVR